MLDPMKNYESKAAILEAFHDEAACIAHLEEMRWHGIVVSPFNPISKVYRCKNQYRCSITKKYFNVKTGTLYHNSKIPLQQWFLAIWILTTQKPEITSVALGMELNITQKTAWYMIQRIKLYYPIPKEPRKRPFKKIKPSENPKNENKSAVQTEVPKMAMLEWLQSLKK